MISLSNNQVGTLLFYYSPQKISKLRFNHFDFRHIAFGFDILKIVKDPRELLKKEDTDDIKKIKDAFSNMFNKTKNSAEEEAKKVQKKAVEIGEKAK